MTNFVLSFVLRNRDPKIVKRQRLPLFAVLGIFTTSLECRAIPAETLERASNSNVSWH
jgi:hypothetical protein